MKVVFTGAPCTGKSSVVDNISVPGFSKSSEVARYWLNFTEANNLTEYRKPRFFEQLIEISHLNNYTNYDSEENVFFDRQLPDEIAYRKFYNMEVPEYLIEYCHQFPVDKVFFFPYWPEIYQNDSVRVETLEQAEKLDGLLLSAYKSVGYNPIIVPKVSVEERIEFIISNL